MVLINAFYFNKNLEILEKINQKLKTIWIAENFKAILKILLW